MLRERAKQYLLWRLFFAFGPRICMGDLRRARTVILVVRLLRVGARPAQVVTSSR
jgi:hypothetical protein